VNALFLTDMGMEETCGFKFGNSASVGPGMVQLVVNRLLGGRPRIWTSFPLRGKEFYCIKTVPQPTQSPVH
jgi:hypothetical protein